LQQELYRVRYDMVNDETKQSKRLAIGRASVGQLGRDVAIFGVQINSTSSDDNASNGEEDVLYQRGASFSAKLDISDLHISMKSFDDDDGAEEAKTTSGGSGGRQGAVTKARPPSSANPNSINAKSDELARRKANRNWKLEPSSKQSANANEGRARSSSRKEKSIQNDGLPALVTAYGDGMRHDQRQQQHQQQHPKTSASGSDRRNQPCTLDCGSEGTCYISPEGSSSLMRCLCAFGKTGQRCEEDAKVNTPRFSKHSWVAFPALRGAYKHVQLHIEFRPESFDGILLLTGERDDLTGDFMALLLHQGFVEFWFDCGSGMGRVKSEETIVLNQWNTITIYRHRWDAWLVLNQGNRVQGRSKGLFSRITFREPVFLGGYGNITGLDRKLPVSTGFTGCIRKFVANDHDYNFQQGSLGDVSHGFDIQECITDRCSRYPCQHGGKCLPSDDGAICLCPLGFGGDLCEMRLDLQVPSFNGSSYLRYAPLGDSCIIWFELKIIIKPLLEDGLLLYSGHHEYGDYISLCLNMGHVEFTYDLGSGPATVRSEFPLSMGQWHTIKVSRTSRLAVLKIDQLPEVMTVSPNGFWHLSLPHSLYLGGIHNVHTLPTSLRDKGSFAGCIQKVDINDRTIAIISEALGGSNVENCPHACVARPCGPLAKCVPNLDTYECQCNPQNRQCNKAEELPSEVIEKQQRLLKRKQQEQAGSSWRSRENRQNRPGQQGKQTEPEIDETLIEEMNRIMKNHNDNDNDADETLDASFWGVGPSSDGYGEPSLTQREYELTETDAEETHDEGAHHHQHHDHRAPSHYRRRNGGACFTGTDSYFHYSDAETMRRVISYEIDLNLRFKTHSANGLILWTGRHSALEGDDFLSLGIENGYLHLRYNLGSGEINIKYNSTKVSDGLWHRVRALRNSQDGTLKVDGGKPITRRSPGKLRQLNTDTGLYVAKQRPQQWRSDNTTQQQQYKMWVKWRNIESHLRVNPFRWFQSAVFVVITKLLLFALLSGNDGR
uniref:Pikachurin n=1 Tax=Anopheles coluzzii TaxID=1518534 RepID=A0A8W7PQ16_ANOCL